MSKPGFTRWVWICLVSFVVAGMLPGCDRRPPATLTFWTISLSPTYDDYIEGLIEEFEGQNPGVTVEWVDLPQQAARQKLMAGIAAGDPPDVVNMDTEFSLVLAEHGALSDVSKYVSDEQRERYFPNIWAATKTPEGVFAVPWYVTTKVIMYNQAILSQAGLDPDRPPRTWDELDHCSSEVVKHTKAVGMMPSIRIINEWSMAGAPIVDREELRASFTEPASVEVLERYRRLYQSGVMPPETLTEGYRGALDRYKAGSLAFLETGPQFLLRIKADAPNVYQQTGIAPLPRTQTDTLPAATMNFSIPRSVENKELAVKLALFLTSPQAQLEFCKQAPILPSTVETTKDSYFQEEGEDPLLSEAVRISLSQLPRARDFSLGLPRQKDLVRALNSAVEKAIRGEMSSQEALSWAAQEWERTLAPYRK